MKFDKNMDVAYQFEYSDTYELTGQTVTEKGQPTSRYDASYDAEGNLTGYKSEDLKKNSEDQRVSIARDSSAQVSTVNYLNRKGTEERWQNAYSARGLKESFTRFSAEDKGLERIDYSYDDNDKLIERTQTTNGVVKERYEWTYDDQGNITSKHSYRRFLGKLDLLYYLIFTYDEGNRLIRRDY